MAYVDAYVLPVPKKKVPAYRRLAQRAAKAWRKHGAIEYREAVGNDLNTKMGVSFSQRVKAKPGETVVVSWVLFKSRAHRDQVNRKVMKDPAVQEVMQGELPFDVKRMAYGGFKIIVDK